MDIQTIITNQLQAERSKRLKTSDQLTLGELILKLKSIPVACDAEGVEEKEERIVEFDFPEVKPGKLDSWRGSYAELAISFTHDDSDQKWLTLSEFIKELESAIGKEFTGYKGGEYLMGKSTPLWVASYGCASETGMYDISYTDRSVKLLTKEYKY